MTLVAADLLGYVGIAAPTAAETSFATRVLNVSNEHLSTRVNDTTCFSFEQAVLMYAARLWKRKNSIEGVWSLGDFSGDVKSWDSDIEALLATCGRAWRFGA